MKFLCSTTEMMEKLSLVTRALAAKSPLPILENILVETANEGLLITATDLSLGIQASLPAVIEEAGRVALPGKLFAEIVRKLPEGEMRLQVNGTVASLSCMGNSTNLTCMNASEYPQLPSVSGRSVTMDSHDLKEMIQMTQFAISMDNTRPILTGCLLEVENNQATMVALDGPRLALCRSEKPVDAQESLFVVIPGRIISEIGRLLSEDGLIELVFSGSHLRLQTESAHVVARLLDGEYIKYRRLIPSEHKTEITVDKEVFSESLDRVFLMARETKNNLVRLAIAQDALVMQSNSEIGDIKELIPVVTQGRDLEIAFNIKFLADVFKAVPQDQVIMRFDTSITPCMVLPTMGDRFLYLVVPVRVFAD